jgi:transposase InsO family protein
MMWRSSVRYARHHEAFGQRSWRDCESLIVPPSRVDGGVTKPDPLWGVGDVLHVLYECKEYMGAAFCDAIVAHGMRQSDSVRGPGDNAHAESFRHSLKAELTRGVTFLTDHALRSALREYIRYYNRTNLHSSLNYTSPIAFERCVA